MGARAEATRRTRESILDATEEAFVDKWYDEVTLLDVARIAGVSQQTVVNHFGSKDKLYLATIAERVAPRITAVRDKAVIGDVRSIVATAIADYETTGEGTWRVVATADRYPAMAELAMGGRAAHRDWVRSRFEPLLTDHPARTTEVLTTLLDVRTWHQLRHESGMTPEAVIDTLVDLIEAALDRA